MSGLEFIADSQAIALAFNTAIDGPKLLLKFDLGVGTVLKTPRAYLNFESQLFLIILEIQERTEMGREHVGAYQHFEWEIGHDAEFVQNDI